MYWPSTKVLEVKLSEKNLPCEDHGVPECFTLWQIHRCCWISGGSKSSITIKCIASMIRSIWCQIFPFLFLVIWKKTENPKTWNILRCFPTTNILRSLSILAFHVQWMCYWRFKKALFRSFWYIFHLRSLIISCDAIYIVTMHKLNHQLWFVHI